jgi:recombination protein RecR
MLSSSQTMEKLIREFSKLPGIGRKTATRLAFWILKRDPKEVTEFADAIRDARQKVKACSICFNITESDPCEICRSERRDRSLICVVEEANDLMALEKTGQYTGLYHVLGGALSPLDGIGPEQLHVKELIERLRSDEVKEVIIATNPNVEGEATAAFLAKLIKPIGVKVTRIARGLPVGSDLEYADDTTLGQAISNRRDY